MQRRAAKVVVFLLLGAIVNIAMAWGCAIWSTARYDETKVQEGDSLVLHKINLRNGAKVKLKIGTWHWAEANVIGAHWRQMYRVSDENPEDAMMQYFAGLPLRTVYCVGRVTLPPKLVNGELTSTVQWERGFDLPAFFNAQLTPYFVVPSVERPLPCLLKGSGFAINTIFYAAVLWMMFAMPGVLRRRRRIKRGLCPACAYPVCTECGGMLPSPSRK